VARLTAALAGRYRIERELGQGGMATVYLAEDLKHDRKVALKVLKPELAAVIGAERFLAEIKTTANLQHPHILALFDSGEVDGTVFYVMPFVDGESLRDRLARDKQLPIPEAVQIASEVADALEYAHRHGVVHRDIKPENILLHGGHALVVDFGIALAASRTDGGARMTETGMSLGTPHYMSPEQAMGEREITARSDVYALGCVLYEMLVAEPPFTGPTAQAIVARVMTEDPRSLTAQRRTIPPHLEAAVMAALNKLPADRFATAARFAEALASPAAALPGRGTVASAVPPAEPGRWRMAAMVLSVVALIAAATAIWAMARPAATGGVARFALVLGDSVGSLRFTGRTDEPSRLAISPDGTQLLYTGYLNSEHSRHGLFLRTMDQLAPRFLPGTDSALAPAVSPDGGQVAFMTGDRPTDRAIKIASLRGGPPITVFQGGVGANLSWGSGGYVYFLDPLGQVMRRVSSSGGPAEDVLRLGALDSTATFGFVNVLPGGRSALVATFPSNRDNEAGYVLRGVNLETGAFGAAVQGVAGVYAASGHLLYITIDGTLMAVPFDAKRLILSGRPAALIRGLDVRPDGMTDLSLSDLGTLVYATEGLNAAEQFVWVSRTGQVDVVDPQWNDVEFESFDLSPDGTRAAVTIVGGRADIWVKQLDQGPKSRLTFGGEANFAPSWTADGHYVSYVSLRDGRTSLWRRRADGVGAEELIADPGRGIPETRWSRDGRWLLLSLAGPPSQDIFVMRLGEDSVPRPLLAEPHDEGLPSLSPDGRWLAYVSTETGEAQVFVRPFPAVQDGKWQISTTGGDAPVWSRDGRELIFRDTDRKGVYTVDMTRGPSEARVRKLLTLPAESQFETNGLNGHMLEISPDGRRFLMVLQGRGDQSGDLVLVQNFFQVLRAITAPNPERP
jgi:Tol biopolymer transport system component/tRNA A-37 threonylcarbamoyl transferase component Bud32